MYSDKKTVNQLLQLCLNAGIREAVISPGSRNAPLIFSFTACEAMKCLTIVDERSAAFFALGMAQQLGRPVALICTSGTAVLNYAPAIAEAYYQRIPLVVITADRPAEWIDQADGQTIRQNDIYRNYIEYSCSLNNKDNTQVIQEALQVAHTHNAPVHINVPLEEPLYHTSSTAQPFNSSTENAIDEAKMTAAATFNFQLSTFNSILFLVGQRKPDKVFNQLLSEFAEKTGAVVLTETTSNLNSKHFIPCIDRVLASIPKNKEGDFAPDLLITFDGQVTSKRIKQFIRRNKPREHWHITTSDKPAPDTYRCLTKTINATPIDFLNQFNIQYSTFNILWHQQHQFAEKRHHNFIKNLSWSDLKVFSIIKDYIPNDTMLQVANSTPVRYLQLFEEYNRFDCFANRGTSGIDGCTSTAAGAAYAAEKPTLFITGDLSFLYDSNALWNNYLRPDFKIIVINNSGGGIFRYVSGEMPEETMAQYFEATQRNISIELLVKSYGLDYHLCKNEDELHKTLPLFFSNNDNASVLEIKTPNQENAILLRQYMSELILK
jgi:2-succinyl-5-enolpyruvyl-6-hydroxy-3-cyclohexene-1-carboxylate synthase